jgi:hypothetical protein
MPLSCYPSKSSLSTDAPTSYAIGYDEYKNAPLLWVYGLIRISVLPLIAEIPRPTSKVFSLYGMNDQNHQRLKREEVKITKKHKKLDLKP